MGWSLLSEFPVSLLVCADIFSKGIISLKFIDFCLTALQWSDGSQYLIGIFLIVFVFLITVLTGSGSSSFHSLAPFISRTNTQLGINSLSVILP
ncbi:MAG: hypothetical protein JXA77_18955, partial [Bacteroidales bacterium]|nr:hypothetical protein [Bacteroidales bacterium]